jgi:hypothetical protein
MNESSLYFANRLLLSVQVILVALGSDACAARVLRDRTTKVSRGTGFVDFSSWEDLLVAVVNVNGLEYRGKSLLAMVSWNSVKSAPKPPSDLRKKLFDDVCDSLIPKLQMDQVAEYSVTPLSMGNQICEMILHLYGFHKGSKSIIDGTACVGGNVISFSRYFSKVVAVEIDESRFNMLKNNVDVLSIKNVDCFCADFSKLVQESDVLESMDYLFLDPPWGGRDYKNSESLRLKLGDTGVADLCQRIRSKCSSIRGVILKLPHNFCFDDLVTGEMLSQFPVVVHCRFPTISIVFMDSEGDLPSFIERTRTFPVTPESSLFFTCFKDRRWAPITSESLHQFIKKK